MRRAEPLARGLVLALTLVSAAAADARPEIVHWRTQGGARVYFVAARELPMVDVRLLFDAGSARDGPLHGLAGFTSAMLLEGAGGLSGQAVAERFAALGTEVAASADRDTASLSLRSLRDPAVLEPGLALLRRVLHAPDFPPDAVARVRHARQVALRRTLQSPGGRADQVFHGAVYGDHPYAHPPLGDEAGLARIGRAEMTAFHARHYVAANAVLALVGDLTVAEARRLAAALLEGLPAGAPPEPLPPVEAPRAPRTRWVEHPSSQSHVLVGQPAVARGDPDFFALYVGNHVLGGGGLVSVLGETVREARGLAYSARSRLTPLRRAGPFRAGLQTRNETVHDALDVLRRALARLVASGPSASELTRAKKNIIGGFALRTDSNRKLLDLVGTIGFYGLPLDYLERFRARVAAVTAEEVREALRRRLPPAHTVTVVVGGARDPGGASAP